MEQALPRQNKGRLLGKVLAETQWRWRDLSRFTHLIVRPEWRSSPRRQLWLTSGVKPGLKSQTSRIKIIYIYIYFKNLGKKEGKKTASTPANGVATSGIKEAHLDDFLVVCVEREGRRRRRRRRRGDTVVKRACQLQSLSHSGFYHLKRWNENRRDYAKNWTSPLTLSTALALCFWTPKPYAGARLFSFPRSLGRTV